jgi:hypothetical protein
MEMYGMCDEYYGRDVFVKAVEKQTAASSEPLVL